MCHAQFLASVLFFLLTALEISVFSMYENEIDYRLPITVIPSHYMIKLIPYFGERNFTFDGEVEITVNATAETNNITLHYEDMDIVQKPIVNAVDRLHGIEVVSTTYDNSTHLYRMELNESLQAGQQYQIHITYIGHLQNQVSGFYRCHYKTKDNEARWFATTYFEPALARKAFPCFDEPALKAKFQINIARTPDYHVISNMPQDNISEPDPNIGGRIWEFFKETPPMSTYLVAFMVSDFKNLSTPDGKYNVWVQEDYLPYAKYALSITPSIVKFMENYTDVNYELPKLDAVADSCFSGAMENWGLTIYQDWELLLRDHSELMKQHVTYIVIHEISHMWFGNLVTPAWWDNLWLKEGFARYFEYIIISELEPHWHVEELFVVNTLQHAFYYDATIAAHPLIEDAGNPSEPSDILLNTVYDKGACIIRMMEHFLTHETFQKGLKRFFKANAYGIAEEDDLFDALNDQQNEDNILPSDMNVKTIMDSWTLQGSFPIIHVQRRNGSFHIFQEKFLAGQEADTTASSTWWVPISYCMGNDMDFTVTKPSTWLKGKLHMELMDNITDSDWIILNLQAINYYRVNYDPHTWSLITLYMKSANYKNIHVLNRAQLLDDAFFLANASLLNYSIAFELSTYLAEETDYIPWASYLTIISRLNVIFQGTGVYESFRNYVLHQMKKIYDFISSEENEQDDLFNSMSRLNILYWACYFGYEDCIRWASEHFTKWLENPKNSTLSLDLRSVLYCTALAYRSREDLQNMWEQLANYNMTTEFIYVLIYFNCTNISDLILYHLNEETLFENREKFSSVTSLRSSLRGRHLRPFNKWLNCTVAIPDNNVESEFRSTAHKLDSSIYGDFIDDGNFSQSPLYKDVVYWFKNYGRQQLT